MVSGARRRPLTASVSDLAGWFCCRVVTATLRSGACEWGGCRLAWAVVRSPGSGVPIGGPGPERRMNTRGPQVKL